MISNSKVTTKNKILAQHRFKVRAEDQGLQLIERPKYRFICVLNEHCTRRF